jgi:hypothetical protein
MTQPWWWFRQMTCAGVVCVLAGSVWAAEPAPLHARIVSKQGARAARQWTFEIATDPTVRQVTVDTAQFTVLQAARGAACRPVITSPSSFPIAVPLAGSGTGRTTLTINFRDCSNQAQFRLELRLSSPDGARTLMRRSNEYR